MHARELVELGAVVAAHAPLFLRSHPWSWEASIQNYWTSSKCRFDRWARELQKYRLEQPVSSAQCTEGWRALRPVLEEILTGDLLTRVWTAVAIACERHGNAREIEPVVRSVYVGHLEARRKALSIMVYGRGFSVEDAVQLNRLRRRTERWTDVLLGRLNAEDDAIEFAFDPPRVRDFSVGIKGSGELAHDPNHWRLLLASMRAAFQTGMSDISPNADLNQQIAASVLSFFREESFDSTGLPKSLWLERLYSAANDSQAMIEELIAMDQPISPAMRFAVPPTDPLRRFPQ